MLNFTYQKQLIKSVLVQQNIDLTEFYKILRRTNFNF